MHLPLGYNCTYKYDDFSMCNVVMIKLDNIPYKAVKQH